MQRSSISEGPVSYLGKPQLYLHCWTERVNPAESLFRLQLQASIYHMFETCLRLGPNTAVGASQRLFYGRFLQNGPSDFARIAFDRIKVRSSPREMRQMCQWDG